MNNWFEKKRLSEQLKFFGAKKTKFVSCYASKPRISMKEDRYRFDLRPFDNATREALRNRRHAEHQQAYNQQVLGVLGNQQSGLGQSSMGLYGGLGGASLSGGLGASSQFGFLGL